VNILYLGVAFFVGVISGVLFLSLCIAAKTAERKIPVSKNFHLAECRRQDSGHGR